VITISDTGVGISTEMVPQVFEMFTQGDAGQERAGGLGIGLALARRLTEMHEGRIEAHSDGPGRGSTFTITVPLCDTEARQLPPPDDVPRVSCRVVVIDDNRDAASTTSMLVERLGASARTAHDAATGLAIVEKFKPDVIFLDIGMPGIDGYEACRRVRLLPSEKRVVIVAVTGWGQSHDKQRALDAGFDAHLTKPVDPATLARVLARSQATH
jgi:CheY-like chemotaxis protein